MGCTGISEIYPPTLKSQKSLAFMLSSSNGHYRAKQKKKIAAFHSLRARLVYFHSTMSGNGATGHLRVCLRSTNPPVRATAVTIASASYGVAEWSPSHQLLMEWQSGHHGISLLWSGFTCKYGTLSRPCAPAYVYDILMGPRAPAYVYDSLMGGNGGFAQTCMMASDRDSPEHTT